MKKRNVRKAQRFAVVVSVALICVCTIEKVTGLSPEAGASALMLAAGLKVEDSSPPGFLRDIPVMAGEEEGEEEHLVILEDDGIVPFHQDELPALTATPDPSRDSLPVEEITAEGGQRIDNFYVKDSTESGTDLAAELLNDPAIDIKANGEVEVLLYHTHTSESYLDAYTGFYYTDMQTRSQNTENNVVAVGQEIKKELEAAGIGVVHDASVNDTMFNGSYGRSWEVLQKNLAEHPGIQVTIDIHRDSMTTEEGIKYKPTLEVGGRKAAQMMLIAGCDANGGWGDFPNWLDNLHLAMRVQQRAETLYPGLLRPLNFSNSKYNMNATKGSLLVEVGTEVNTISEAKYAGKLMGRILGDLLKNGG